MSDPVNLFLTGAARSGTTALADALSGSSEIFLSSTKEPHYFGEDLEIHEKRTLREYESLYRSGQNFAYRLDASTHVMASREGLEAIRAYNPDAKLLILLRDPVLRAYSHYRHKVNNGSEHRSLSKCIDEGASVITRNPTIPDQEPIVQLSLYHTGIQNTLDLFPSEHVHILLFEDLVQNPEQELESLSAFLGIPRLDPEAFRQRNESPTPTAGWRASVLSNTGLARRTLQKVLPHPVRKQIHRWAKRKSIPYQFIPPLTVEQTNQLRALFKQDVQKTSELLHRTLTQIWWNEG